jgi:hypothetical protein
MRALIGEALDRFVPHMHRASEPEEVGWAIAPNKKATRDAGDGEGGVMATQDATLAARFQSAALVINREQANALADLMWEGKLKGTVLPDVDPPDAVALVPLGRRESRGTKPAQNRDGSHRFDDDGMVSWENDPPAHTLGAVAEDGRCWQIVRAGIIWPIEA